MAGIAGGFDIATVGRHVYVESSIFVDDPMDDIQK